MLVMRQAQLGEEEIFIYLLIESGMAYRDLGRRLGVSHYYLLKKYEIAKEKVDKLTAAGLLSTDEK